MKIVKQGEKADRSVSIAGEVVTRQHVTLNKATKSEYALTWSFDFSGVSQNELMTIASRAIVIALRPEFKVASASELETWDNRIFSVREYLDSERSKVDDVEKARRLLGKLSQEQRDLILASLGE
jgi:hypothetical protein